MKKRRNEPESEPRASDALVREQYLRRVIEIYLDSPETPVKVRPADWAVAGDFYRKNIDLSTLAHAIRLSTLRRRRRDPSLAPLEPVRSLAYFRPLIEHIERSPHDSGYVDYIRWSYENHLDG